MTINEIKRPYEKKKGNRISRSPFYRSKIWYAVVRPEFRLGYTTWNGQQVPNTLCIECFKQGQTILGPNVDHIVAIKDGGSSTDIANLQALCDHHHAVKSAEEGNNRRKNKHYNR